MNIFSLLEIQASTPVAAAQNDIIEDDEELLNEDDDDDELDDLESGEDMNTQHLVLAQFDKVMKLLFLHKVSVVIERIGKICFFGVVR